MMILTAVRNITLAATALGLFATAELAAQQISDSVTEEMTESSESTDRAADAEMDASAATAEVTTVELNQTPGEFTTTHLDLAPGQYQFEITNDGVDHEVGFVIQRAEDQDGDVMETAIENSFSTAPIAPGTTESTGVVTLEPGEYVYSCPLNPTPHYTITVE